MSPKARFVFLSTGGGILFFAIAGFLTGFILGSTGNQHPHGPGALMIAIIGAIYLAPVGAVVGLIGSLVLKEASFKKMLLILAVCFIIIVVAAIAYVKFQVARP